VSDFYPSGLRKPNERQPNGRCIKVDNTFPVFAGITFAGIKITFSRKKRGIVSYITLSKTNSCRREAVDF